MLALITMQIFSSFEAVEVQHVLCGKQTIDIQGRVKINIQDTDTVLDVKRKLARELGFKKDPRLLSLSPLLECVYGEDLNNMKIMETHYAEGGVPLSVHQPTDEEIERILAQEAVETERRIRLVEEFKKFGWVQEEGPARKRQCPTN